MSTDDQPGSSETRARQIQRGIWIREATSSTSGRAVDTDTPARMPAPGAPVSACCAGTGFTGDTGVPCEAPGCTADLADDESLEEILAAFESGLKGVTRRPALRRIRPLIALTGNFEVLTAEVDGRALLSMRCRRHPEPYLLIPATGIRPEGGLRQDGLNLAHLVDMAARHEREHRTGEEADVG